MAAPIASAAAPAAGLTDRRLAGQRVIRAFAGRTPPSELLGAIRRGEAAGVILFGSNVAGGPSATRALVDRLQAVPRPPGLRAPLLVMIDQEGGLVRRLPGGPPASAADLGRAGPRAAAAAGRGTGRLLRAAGVGVDLAPVADVARPGSAIGAEGRSFGGGPAVVARSAGAFAGGLRSAGVTAAAKHFPGMGAAGSSTDEGPVRIDLPLAALRAVDERPFRALIRTGVQMVMVGTAVYPALDGRPAALSPRVVGGELRGRLGFRGVTITDALDTPALRAAGGDGPAAVGAAAAGEDLVLFSGPSGGAVAVDAIAAALREGRLARAPAEVAAARVLALRASAAAGRR